MEIDIYKFRKDNFNNIKKMFKKLGESCCLHNIILAPINYLGKEKGYSDSTTLFKVFYIYSDKGTMGNGNEFTFSCRYYDNGNCDLDLFAFYQGKVKEVIENLDSDNEALTIIDMFDCKNGEYDNVETISSLLEFRNYWEKHFGDYAPFNETFIKVALEEESRH